MNQSRTPFLLSTTLIITSTLSPALKPPPPQEAGNNIQYVLQEAQRDVGQWRWKNQSAAEGAVNRYIRDSCALADVHQKIMLFKTALDEFEKIVVRAHTTEDAVQCGNYVKKLGEDIYTALDRIDKFQLIPQDIKQKIKDYEKDLKKSQARIRDLFISISVTSEEAQKALTPLSQKIDKADLSLFKTPTAYGNFIENTFEEIINTKDLAVISILMNKLAEKCSMSLDLLEILYVNFYTQKHEESKAQEDVPPLPEEAPPVEGEEGAGAPPPPPPPPMEMPSIPSAPVPPAQSLAAQLKGRQLKATPKAEREEKEQKAPTQQEALLAAIRNPQKLRHIEKAHKPAQGQQPAPFAQLSKNQQAHDLSLEAQVKKLEDQIKNIPQEIAKIPQEIAAAQKEITKLTQEKIAIQAQLEKKQEDLKAAQSIQKPEIKEDGSKYDKNIHQIRSDILTLQKQATELQKKIDLPKKLTEKQKNLARNLTLAQATLAKLQQKKELTIKDLMKQAANDRRKKVAPEEEEEW